MPECRLGGVRVRFSMMFPAMLYFLCLQHADRTVVCLLAAVMHECGHLLVLLLLKNRPREIRFSAFGMCLVLGNDPLTTGERVLLSLGGPAVNFLTAGLLFLSKTGGETAMVHLLIGGMNVLPIRPLDGGQCLPPGRVSRGISLGFLVVLSALAVGLLFLGNVTLAVVCAYLWIVQTSQTKD